MPDSPDIGFTAIEAAETALLTSVVRRNRDEVENLLHPEFIEIGRSGRRLTRSDVIARFATEQPRPAPETGEWKFTRIADNLVLVTYTVGEPGRRSRYSSIWDTSPATPVIRFHQGTPIAAEPPGLARNPGDDDTFLADTRDGYDATAAAYAERFHRHLDGKPLDRAVIAGFAGLVRATGSLRVADVGCGTGATAAMLRDLEVEPFGIDLSAGMVAQAQRLNPDLDFRVGSMLELHDLSDASLGGVCAWYSIIHVPDQHLPQVFDEFYRVLAPGGSVLLAFQVGQEPRVLTEAFGEAVRLSFIRRQPSDVTALLGRAGLPVYAQLTRKPDRDESTSQAYLLARKS